VRATFVESLEPFAPVISARQKLEGRRAADAAVRVEVADDMAAAAMRKRQLAAGCRVTIFHGECRQGGARNG